MWSKKIGSIKLFRVPKYFFGQTFVSNETYCLQNVEEKKIVYKMIWTNVTRTNDALTLDKCLKHLVSSHFCELRLHAEFQLPRLSRSQKKRWAPGGWVGGSVAEPMHWVGCGAYALGGSWLRIMPRCGSILQAGTCRFQLSWKSKMEPSVAISKQREIKKRKSQWRNVKRVRLQIYNLK